ncbi:uncharacterized protein LOC132631064 [Lycium barbarum]|uniref:uncharacterized protein LOC132631064 n=1 Tax=Lycium barbarum TaxID=112863 RepID=UPI00293F4FAD|nr:uncharacterized protein LOC132631064 [Lycium barbarum]
MAMPASGQPPSGDGLSTPNTKPNPTIGNYTNALQNVVEQEIPYPIGIKMTLLHQHITLFLVKNLSFSQLGRTVCAPGERFSLTPHSNDSPRQHYYYIRSTSWVLFVVRPRANPSFSSRTKEIFSFSQHNSRRINQFFHLLVQLFGETWIGLQNSFFFPKFQGLLFNFIFSTGSAILGNHLTSAAIIGQDGTVWAQPANFPQTLMILQQQDLAIFMLGL